MSQPQESEDEANYEAKKKKKKNDDTKHIFSVFFFSPVVAGSKI